jgi:hypothetical protein
LKPQCGSKKQLPPKVYHCSLNTTTIPTTESHSRCVPKFAAALFLHIFFTVPFCLFVYFRRSVTFAFNISQLGLSQPLQPNSRPSLLPQKCNTQKWHRQQKEEEKEEEEGEAAAPAIKSSCGKMTSEKLEAELVTENKIV